MTQLTSIAESLQKFCGDGNVEFRSYSGRGMYGKQCVAITGDFSACMQMISEVIKDLHDEVFNAAIDSTDDRDSAPYDLDSAFSGAVDDLMDFSYDSMGLDVVVYWPNVEFVGPDEDESEDEQPKEV
jgi:hypothetical protein